MVLIPNKPNSPQKNYIAHYLFVMIHGPQKIKDGTCIIVGLFFVSCHSNGLFKLQCILFSNFLTISTWSTSNYFFNVVCISSTLFLFQHCMTYWSIITQHTTLDLWHLNINWWFIIDQKKAIVGKILPWGLHFNFCSCNCFIINCIVSSFFD
jgi:hypothetical protein